MQISLRKAVSEDIPEILSLIRELALYERAPHEVTVTAEELERDGFGENPLFEVTLAETRGRVVGMAFCYISYSTWKGKCLYLEDIIVREAFRGMKIGKKLFESCIIRAAEIGARRLQWQVLDWNEPAIRFYKKYHAILDPEWMNGRLTRDQIRTLQRELTGQG